LERVLPGEGFEKMNLYLRPVPDVEAAEDVRRPVQGPDGAHVPALPFADGLENPGGGLLQRRCLGQDLRDGEPHAAATLRPLPFAEVAEVSHEPWRAVRGDAGDG